MSRLADNNGGSAAAAATATKKARPCAPTGSSPTASPPPLLELCERLGNAGVLCALLDRRDLRRLTQVNRALSRSKARRELFRRLGVRLPSASDGAAAAAVAARMAPETRALIRVIRLTSTAELPTAARYFGHCSGLLLTSEAPTRPSLAPLQSLTKLRQLSLNLMQAPSVDLAPLAHLADMVHLFIKVTSGDDFSFARQMPKLESLSISTKSTLANLAFLRDSSHLRHLDFGGVAITDFSHLRHLEALTSLHLASTAIADVRMLSGLRHLRTLAIDGTKVRDLSPLAMLLQLTDLSISRTKVESVEVLRKLPNLVKLNVTDCRSAFDDDELDWAPLTALQQLAKLRGVALNTASASLLRSLEHLKYLSIHLDTDDSGDAFAWVRSLTQLEVLFVMLTYTRADGEDDHDGDDGSAELLAFPDLSTLVRLKELAVLSPKRRISSAQFLPPTLERLTLSGVMMDDLSSLASLIHLVTLRLVRFRESLPSQLHLDLSPLAKLRRLESLTLQRVKVKRLETISRLTQLSSLRLEHTNVCDVGAVRGLTALTDLKLAGTLVEDVTPLFGLELLQTLSLPACAPCTQLKARLPALKKLHHPQEDCLAHSERACRHG